MRRLVTALVLASALAIPVTGALAVPSAAPAAAIPNPVGGLTDCTNPPVPAFPDTGAGSIDAGPATITADADPFAKDAKVSIYDVYGWGPSEVTNYDLGCGADALRDPAAATNGTFANAGLRNLLSACAAAVVVLRWATNPSTVSAFDPVTTLMTNAFGSHIFVPLFGLSLMLLSLLLLGRARIGDVRDSSHGVAWGVGVAVVGFAAISWPLAAAPFVVGNTTKAVSIVNSAVAQVTPGIDAPDMASAAAGNLQRTLAYNTWLAMSLGASNGAAAKEYGPRLYKASAFTRAEAARIRANPNLAKPLTEAKQEEFKRAAAEVKDKYPDAYQYLSGHQNGDRLTSATIGWAGWAATAALPAVLGAMILFLGALVALGIGVLPLTALAGAHRRFAGLITGPANYLGGAVMAVVVFGAVTAAHIAAAGGLLEPAAGKNQLLALALLAVLTIATFILLWPVFKMVSPRRLAQAVSTGNSRARQSADEAGRREAVADVDSDKLIYDAAGNAIGSAAGSTHGTGAAAPAEARPHRQLGRSALTGAAQGAISSVALGAATGGTATVAAAAAGAAKGAAASAAIEAAGPTAGRALDAGDLARGKHRAARQDSRAAAASGAASAPRLTAGSASPDPGQGAGSSTRTTAGVRIYRPGDDIPAGSLSANEGRLHEGRTTYTIFTPVGAAT